MFNVIQNGYPIPDFIYVDLYGKSIYIYINVYIHVIEFITEILNYKLRLLSAASHFSFQEKVRSKCSLTVQTLSTFT